jgi:hypothetical protein
VWGSLANAVNYVAKPVLNYAGTAATFALGVVASKIGWRT